MRDPADLLEAAVAAVEALAKKKKAPSRFDARAILVPLGECQLEGKLDTSVLERLQRVLSAHEEAWLEAVAQEMQLSCTEHAQGVDPRFLDHPRYDFEYTVQARERLEHRFEALAVLGIDVDEDLLARVARADAVLEPYLRSGRGETGAN